MSKAPVPKGYKQTEVGVIPEDWDVVSYGEAFYFLSTANYSRAELSDQDDGVLYVHYGDIHTTWNYFLDFNKSTLPTIDKAKMKNYSCIEEGDLIMVDASEDYDGIGKSVEAKNITTKKAISGLHTFLLRGKEGIFVNGFKGYIHSNRLVKTSMDRLTTGLKVYSISKTNLKTIQIPRPTLYEQAAIATVLSDTDALIESLEKLIAKKKAIKQGAMQLLLTGKKRLLGFSGEWEMKRLEDFLVYEQPTAYLVKDIEYNDNNQTPVLTAGKTFVLGYTDEGFGVFDKPPVIIFDDFTTANKFVTFPFKAKSSAMKILKPKDATVNLRFIYEIMQMILFYLNDHKRYWISEYQYLEIKVPSLKEQTAIATILSDMDSEIESLEQKRDKYIVLKQGIMEKLLTGKIRLINPTVNGGDR